MEDLYRRVSDRQTIGSVVQELRASLSEAEKSIDRFFRNPADREVLIPVSQQLSAMRGVLSVLGMEHASAALLRMRDEIDGLASTELDGERVAETGVFDRIAGNLSALGFPDRHAQRAAADGEVAVRVRRRQWRAESGDGTCRRA
jgi:chemosensory pili system protein ChpA (sensor histidine kinase/response regulator)